MQKLIFHTGGSNTRSSDLQAYFLENREIMSKNKIGYNHVPQVTSSQPIAAGNGALLYQCLMESMDEKEIQSLLSSYCDDMPVSICSSELLSYLSVEKWELLRQACDSLSIEPVFVVYLRDVEPFYNSQYDQQIKGHGESKEYFVYVDEAESYNHVQHSQTLVAVFGVDAVKAIHYENANNALDLAFWNCLGLPHKDFDRTNMSKQNKRSLVECELKILRRLNLSTGARYSEQLSNYLIDSRPDLTEDRPVDSLVLQLLRERYQQDLDWANALFFGGQCVLKLGPDELAHLQQMPESIVREIQGNAISWMMERLADKEMNTALLSYETVKHIQGVIKDDFALFNQFFEGSWYLLANPDVAAAQMDPLQHFLAHGVHERRRPVKDMSGFLEALLLARRGPSRTFKDLKGPLKGP